MGRWIYRFQKFAGVCAVIVHKSQNITFFYFSNFTGKTLYSKGFHLILPETLCGTTFQRQGELFTPKYQTSYLYRTLATCGFGGIIILIKKRGKNFVAIKNRLYLPLIKNQTFYYEQS
jgi:hypothetical protein